MGNSSDMHLKQEDYINEQGDLFTEDSETIKQEVSGVINNQEDCETAHDAVWSESAEKILRVLIKIYSKKHNKKLGDFVDDFLIQLKNYKLPDDATLQTYEDLKKDTNFQLLVNRFFNFSSTERSIEGSDKEILKYTQEQIERKYKVKNFSKLCQAIDDMILIAKIEKNNGLYNNNGLKYGRILDVEDEENDFVDSEGNDIDVHVDDGVLRSGLYQIIGKNKFIYRYLFSGDFIDESGSYLKEGTDYKFINQGEGFLLFENYLVTANDFKTIVQFQNNNDGDFEYIGNDTFFFGDLVYEKIDGDYTNVGTVGGILSEDHREKYVHLGNKLLIVGESSETVNIENSNIEYVKIIYKTMNQDVKRIIDNNGNDYFLNIATNEKVYIPYDGDKIEDLALYQQGKLKIKRHGREIEIDLWTGKETEKYSIFQKKLGFITNISNLLLGKKYFPMYSNTIDFVEHGLEIMLLEANISYCDFVELLLDNKSKTKTQLESLIQKANFGNDDTKSEEFKTQFLKIEKVVDVIKKVEFIKELEMQNFENGLLDYPSHNLGLNGIREYFYNSPNYYEIVGHYSSGRSDGPGIAPEKGFTGTKIGDYNIIKNIKTDEIRLVKNFDGKTEDREFIDLGVGFPIAEYITDKNIDRIMERLSDKNKGDKIIKNRGL